MVRSVGLTVCTYGLPALFLFASACQTDTWDDDVPVADFDTFKEQAYPVLLRDCGFNNCHGSQQRFLLIFGPNRARLDPATHHDEPATDFEVQVSYERTRAMLITNGAIAGALLLTKPLAQQAGGVSHGGVDDFKRNVYQSTSDPGYVALLRWAQGVPPALSPPAAVMPATVSP